MLVPVDDLQARLTAALAGRYTIEREIGRGGMAIVFLAFDPTLGRQVAIKVLRPELAASLGPERFLDEIKVAARLSHPYILKLHEAGEARGLLYYSMPLVEGETLRQRLIRQRTLPVPDALRITQEVAEALDHAHRQHIIHRDIKPENILFDETHALVSDFGIAKAISEAGDRRTIPGIVLGTVDYMSPEQEHGVEELDGRTDVYSLGLVLYEMLVGHTPGPDSAVDSLTGHRPDVSAAIVRILRTALARDRANRFATAADFRQALDALTGPPARPALGRGRARRLWWIGVGVAGLAAVVIAIVTRGGTTTGGGGGPLDPTHIAVLYFDDISPDSSLRTVAAGLSEDLMDRLVQVPALHVTSPNGVRAYRGSAGAGQTPDSIARALNVGTIVTGSVTRSGGILRVSVRLVDGSSGQVLHTRQMMRPFGELFALQDTITADIATFLRLRIGETVVLRQRRAGTSSVAAWETVREADALREDAREAVRSGEDSRAGKLLLRADSFYARATVLDGRWAIPHVGRARIAQAFAEQLAERRAGDAARKAAEPLQGFPRYEDEWARAGLIEAERALALGSMHAEALEVRGSLRYFWWLNGYDSTDVSLRDAEDDLRTAVAAKPSLARGWVRLSGLLRFTGRFAEAEEAAAQALDADAFLLEARPVYATLYYAALNLEHYADARTWCARARNRFPNDLEFAHCELRTLGWSGRGRIALAQGWRIVDSLDKAVPANTGTYPAERRLLMAMLYARSGDADSAVALLARSRNMSGQDSTAAWFLLAEARIRLLLGERRPALHLILRTVAANPRLRNYIARAAWFAPLRREPEFVRIIGSPT
ncbi:MAG TPA: serine/threonine-protein kinase [Gemmatimonadales bacterium]